MAGRTKPSAAQNPINFLPEYWNSSWTVGIELGGIESQQPHLAYRLALIAETFNNNIIRVRFTMYS